MVTPSASAATPRATSADKLASLFGDPAESSARPWWRRHRRVGIVLVAIAVVAVCVFATDAFGSSGNSYRTMTVADHDVDSLLTASRPSSRSRRRRSRSRSAGPSRR